MSTVLFNRSFHEFDVGRGAVGSQDVIEDSIDHPLSVIVQVTRRCNLDCPFCSESGQIADPSLPQLLDTRDKLIGTQRVYLSGGEPLLRNDIFAIIDTYRPYFDVLGLPTNATQLTRDICEKLKGRIDYINAGLDGPRLVNDALRGGYDEIISGLMLLKEAGIEVSLSTVVLKDTLPYLGFVIQIADMVGIKKVKMVVPVLRGRAKTLPADRFASDMAIDEKFRELFELKRSLGWRPRIKYTTWGEGTEGYALIVQPDQKVYAWPVFGIPEAAQLVGDLAEETIAEIWAKYPYRRNHVNKYVGITMHKA